MIIDKFNRSLVLKTTVIFLIAAMIPFVLASIFYYRSSKKALSSEITSSLQTRTELIRDAVDARVSLLRSNAVAWADLEVMDDIITDDIDNRISKLIDSFMQDYNIAGNIYVIDRKAMVVASNNLKATNTTIAAAWLPQLLAGKIVNNDIHPSIITGEKVISFIVPVSSHYQGLDVIGALLLEYKVKDLRKLAYKGDSTVMAILTSDGTVVTAYPEDNPFTTASASGKTLAGKDNQEQGILSAPGYIGAVARTRGHYDFKGFDWDVIVAVDQARAMAPIKKIQHISIAIGLVGTVFILGMVTIFARRITRPLKELSHTADLIANTKNFSLTAHSASNDEVGRLADAFNRMIAEVRQHVNRVGQMEDDLSRADRLSALGELSAGMAHEVKNPLGIIKSSAELLSSKLTHDESLGKLATDITEELARLEKFLDTFLQFAKPMPPQIEKCRVNAIIEKALPLLSRHMENAKIELIKKTSMELPSVYTDSNQINQVLVNIIINAVQAMPEGGTLTITTAASVEFPPFDPTRQMKVVIINITDTGRGIDKAHKDKVFNPFFSTKENGTGLGLTIVHRIIENLGGWVRIENVKPHGTAFNIYIPTESTPPKNYETT
jgi:signal transduction histidine kinase